MGQRTPCIQQYLGRKECCFTDNDLETAVQLFALSNLFTHARCFRYKHRSYRWYKRLRKSRSGRSKQYTNANGMVKYQECDTPCKKGDPLQLWFNISAKSGRETKYYQVFLNSSMNTDFRCKQFWDAWNRNDLETNICSISPESNLCPSPRIRNRFRKSWIEPQSMIRLILPIARGTSREVIEC